MKRDNLSKNYLLKKIYYHFGILFFLKKKIDYFFETIIEGLKGMEKLNLSGFGTFKSFKQEKRVGRNPKTKVEYEISSRRVVVFNPSSTIKKEINKKN